MKLLTRIKQRSAGGKKSWTQPPFWTLDDLRSPFYTTGVSDGKETIENDFLSYVRVAYKRNGAIFACMQARQMVFSQARFLWRQFDDDGRPSDLFGSLHGNSHLSLLARPWPGGTTGELLGHMIQDADLAGNSFWTTTDDQGRFGRAAVGSGRRLVRMRPDWVQMILGSNSGDPEALDTKILVYVYKPEKGGVEVHLQPDEVAHFSPTPDPEARFRGMSWLKPILTEIQADTAATVHKEKFFDNAAVPNLAVKFDRDTSEDDFDEFVAKFREGHQGAMNAYKTLFLMGGADVTPLTHSFDQLKFNETIGKGESRIASAAGVPSTWVGFSEGLSGSGLNAQGVFAAARRRFADGTIRQLWQMAAASLEVLVQPPAGAHLWYDDRDIAFLREDSKDRAEIFSTTISSIASGIMAGFEPDAMVQASRDLDVMKLLGNHTGLVSVQMQASRVPDESLDEKVEEMGLLETQAQIVNTLAATGRFIEESVVEAVKTGDITKLKPKPAPEPEPQQQSVEGQPAGERQQQPADDGQGEGDKPKPDDSRHT